MVASMDEAVLHGFTVVPVKFSAQNSKAHYLYLKEHSVRETDLSKPKDKTLFVLNVPPYCDVECLKELFSECGKVERVYLHQTSKSTAPPKGGTKYFPSSHKIRGFKVAYVVFKSAASVQKAKKMSYKETRILSTEKHTLLTGMEKWCKEYSQDYVVKEDFQKEIDEFMASYDEKVQEELDAEQEMEGVPDDDGWIKVTKEGRHKAAPRKEVVMKQAELKEKKRRKEKELLNFYAFQLRETKKQHIADLRMKFEEDKQKIALMKASRRFKPY